jgi:fibro-slime domain-containing protein
MHSQPQIGVAARGRAIAVISLAGLAVGVLGAWTAPRAATSREETNPPTSFKLTATLRDFRAREMTGGHTDFEWIPANGYGHYIGQVADTLNAQGLPVFASTGYKVEQEWQDAEGRNIMNPRSYIDARPGDIAGDAQTSDGGSIHTASAFSQWFRDVPNVNQSKNISLTLTYDSVTGSYVFDERTDPAFSMLGGFFPLDDQLFGNYKSSGHNYGFTCMIETEFQYKLGEGYTFTFRGDDDVWVFVDGKLCIDLGGVHGVVEQVIELDRLNWLEDGKTYSLRFFFAERHTTQSNFRIESNFILNDNNSHQRPAIKGWEEVEPKN